MPMRERSAVPSKVGANCHRSVVYVVSFSPCALDVFIFYGTFVLSATGSSKSNARYHFLDCTRE